MYQPVIPLSGYGGWRFLSRTIDQQKEVYAASAAVQRTETYFRENIGSIKSAEDLVNDRQLLEVALGAFGLDDDLYAKAFIQKVLDDGTLESDALSNKLSDKRYAALSKAFGFGDFDTPRTVLSDFADEILTRYKDRSFEVAVGEVDNDMRMALNLGPALNDILDTASTDTGRWFGVMGNTALRTVFETAMGFPSSFAAIDLDQQLDQFRDRAERMFGTSKVEDFANPEHQEKLIRLYMIRSEAANFSATSAGSIALTLLQGG